MKQTMHRSDLAHEVIQQEKQNKRDKQRERKAFREMMQKREKKNE